MPAIARWILRLGPTNPICVRLVQGGSRRMKHFLIRTGYLAVLIVVLLWTLLVGAGGGQLSYSDLANAGAFSFQIIAYLQIGLICVLAPVFMAGAIAQEANPRTWDIMLTTPLSAAQLVLGNLLGRLLFVIALLIASLPLFAVTQYFGGVPGRSIFASYAIAAMAALLVGAIAITLSVSRLAGRRAVFTFYISAVSYLAVTWAIDIWLRGRHGGGVTILTPLNPFLALEALLKPSSYPQPDSATLGAMGGLSRLWFGSPVLSWVLTSGGLSIAMIAACTAMVRRIGASGGAVWRRSPSSVGSGERLRPSRTVWHNPIAWKEAVARGGALPKRITRWSFIAAGWLWGVAMLILYHTGGWTPDDFRFALLATVWAELAVITLIAINMASTAVSREREEGTLDLLLITPITPSQYLGGKLRGLISFLTPMITVPIGTIMLASLYVMLGGFGSVVVFPTPIGGTRVVDLPLVLQEGVVVAPLVIVPFIAFCVVIGLQWSLKSKGTLASVTKTFGIIAVTSGVVGACAWRAGSDIAFIGPALTCLNPATAIFALVHPDEGVLATLRSDTGGRGVVQISLLLGAGASTLLFLVIIYSMHTSMVRTFDQTVRKLAGAS
jgi:ABC-type transport system involved in multi-copper enzyme maturation permease subunit